MFALCAMPSALCSRKECSIKHDVDLTRVGNYGWFANRSFPNGECAEAEGAYACNLVEMFTIHSRILRLWSLIYMKLKLKPAVSNSLPPQFFSNKETKSDRPLKIVC